MFVTNIPPQHRSEKLVRGATLTPNTTRTHTLTHQRSRPTLLTPNTPAPHRSEKRMRGEMFATNTAATHLLLRKEGKTP